MPGSGSSRSPRRARRYCRITDKIPFKTTGYLLTPGRKISYFDLMKNSIFTPVSSMTS
jgi:hypothetical protein